MINTYDLNHDNKEEKNKNEEISINNDLSSDKKRIIKIKSKDCKLIIESLNNYKLTNFPKHKSDKYKYKNLSNYSFSNKTSGNELSKKRFETIEKTVVDLNEEINKNYFLKNVPIYINHSDYFYCPNSMKEKNLKMQIMKYLAQNNLIKNADNSFQKKKNTYKMKKNKSFKIEKGLQLKKKNFFNNPISEKENNHFKNKNESIEILQYEKEKYEINNDKIVDSEQTNYTVQDYVNQIENNKTSNIQIKYIDNITNKNKIDKIEHINTIDKPKEKFYTFRTGKIIGGNTNINVIKISSNKNFFSNSSSLHKKIIKEKIKKNKDKIKNRKLIPKYTNKKSNSKNKIKNYSKKINDINNKSNILNNKNNIKNSFEIISKVVNEQFIDKNIKNNSFELSIISLQSINDSKMFEMAEHIIPKEEELEKFKENNKRTIKNKI